jgi:hypothetical protein
VNHGNFSLLNFTSIRKTKNTVSSYAPTRQIGVVRLPETYPAQQHLDHPQYYHTVVITAATKYRETRIDYWIMMNEGFSSADMRKQAKDHGRGQGVTRLSYQSEGGCPETTVSEENRTKRYTTRQKNPHANRDVHVG